MNANAVRILCVTLLLHAAVYCSQPSFSNQQCQRVASLLYAQRQGLHEIDSLLANTRCAFQLLSILSMARQPSFESRIEEIMYHRTNEEQLMRHNIKTEYYIELKNIFHDASQAAIMLRLREIDAAQTMPTVLLQQPPQTDF